MLISRRVRRITVYAGTPFLLARAKKKTYLGPFILIDDWGRRLGNSAGLCSRERLKSGNELKNWASGRGYATCRGVGRLEETSSRGLLMLVRTALGAALTTVAGKRASRLYHSSDSYF